MFLDGVDVREIPLERLRGAIGFVPQEPFLFSDTIAENVAFGVGVPSPANGDGERAVAPDRLHEAAAVARLDKDVATSRRATRRWSGARHHAVGRPEAADGDRARGRRSTRGS